MEPGRGRAEGSEFLSFFLLVVCVCLVGGLEMNMEMLCWVLAEEEL